MLPVVVVLALAGIAHLAFSRYGFNPTDEGFILAGSRRLLEGEIPHRGFVSVRPVLSLVLHLPELVLRRQRCLMNSRLVFWIQMAVFSVVWALALRTPHVALYALLIMALSAQVFPPMAWHTVDALMLASIGLYLLPSSWGFVLIGASVLCRQNFLLLAPFVLVFGITPRAAWMLAPALVYVAAAMALGAGPDLLQQFRAYHARATAFIGLKKFLNVWTIGGGVTGFLLVHFGLNTWFVVVPVAGAAMILARGRADWTAYLSFGMAVAPVVSQRQALPLALIALAWVSSLSIGYRYPALMLGPLGAFLVMEAGASQGVTWAVVLASAVVIAAARLLHVYGDEPAWRLKSRLGEVLQGGAGIRTSARTHRFLDDLNRAKARAREFGGRYAVIPDVPATWLLSEQRNPLSCDWPQDTELGRPELLDRVLAETWQPGLVIIAQKFRARTAHRGDEPFADPPALLSRLRAGATRVAETELFELYLPAAAAV